MQRAAEAGGARIGGALGEAEVEELHLEGRADHDVLGLDVVVEDASRVNVIEGPQTLNHEIVEMPGNLRPAEGGEVPALDVLHRQERSAGRAGGVEIVHLGEVRVAQARHRAEFVLEQLDGLAVDSSRSQEFEGELPVAEAGVPHEVHRPDAPFAEKTHDRVTLVDQPVRTQGHGGPSFSRSIRGTGRYSPGEQIPQM